MKFSKKLKAGETYSFAITGSSITSAHHDDPLNEAERLTIFSKLEGKDRLINNHKAAWQELWKSDIQIVGDLKFSEYLWDMGLYLPSGLGTTDSEIDQVIETLWTLVEKK